jgi:heme-degrading monooxygenase HmoA
MELPLQGLRVVDLSLNLAGPYCGQILADLGAEIVKIERPGGGDDARSWGPPFVDGASAWFASANRNKRSLALDIGSEEGRSLLHRLIASADVFLQNVNPSKLGRLGIDPRALTLRHPRLIYCAISGFGLDGPARDQPGWLGGQLAMPVDRLDQRVIIGTWETRAHWEAWHEDPAFTETRERLEGLQAEPSEMRWYEVVTEQRP